MCPEAEKMTERVAIGPEDELHEQCRDFLMLMRKMWKGALDGPDTEAAQTHMSECPTCLKLFCDMQDHEQRIMEGQGENRVKEDSIFA